jgi:hypothetical protein
MNYTKIQNSKKSYIEYLTNQFNLRSCYTVGTSLFIAEAFPENPKGFEVPTISVESCGIGYMKEQDMGANAKRIFDFEVSVFAKNDLERDYLAGTILEAQEDKSIPYYTYNANGISTLVSYMKTMTLDGFPSRIATPSGEKEHGFVITTSLQLVYTY